jgi:NAD(P)-dependent dehydrogenase (short-subunit alcohol dehydrogenase family)
MPSAQFNDLKEASVYITGGGSGIGAAITEGFVAQGAKVAFIGRSDATGFAADLAEKYDNPPLFIQGDITDTGALQASMAQAKEAHGPITCLINSTPEVTEDFWDQMIQINLKAYFFACQTALPQMQAAGFGSIINFSSISYMMGNAGYPIYTACNSAINGMTRSLAREFGPDKIRVNALAPGWVLTQKQKDLWVTEEGLAAHVARQCLKDTLEPEDILGGCLFLASQSSKMMTGQALVIDGGVVTTG